MRRFAWIPLLVSLAACARMGTAEGVDGGRDAGRDARADDLGLGDAGPVDLGPLGDAACVTSTASAGITRLPVDIVWVIDNSASMAAAITEVQSGLDAFTSLIAARDLDYRVIVVSKRGHGAYTVSGGTAMRYAVCVPPPLASDVDCHDGPRFFQESLEVRSVQGMEQALGALDETAGYAPGDAYGADLGETSWSTRLRPEATKTIVMVSDDNQRMVTVSYTRPPLGDADPTASPTGTVDWLEHMPGGMNPFATTASRVLPVGLLDASRHGLFDGYLFDAIYGFGSTTDDTVRCTFPGGAPPPAASGRTYTAWVEHTGGVRAQICDGHAAWSSFFNDVATAVVSSSRVSCAIDLPAPPDGSMLDPNRVNVDVAGSAGTTMLDRTTDGTAASCGTSQAWYYDSLSSPHQVVLCPAACDAVQMDASSGATTSVSVSFGCMSRLI